MEIEIDINKLINSPIFKKAVKVNEQLKRAVKLKLPSATNEELDWALDKASEYNPKNFLEAKQIMLRLLVSKAIGKYREGMPLSDNSFGGVF